MTFPNLSKTKESINKSSPSDTIFTFHLQKLNPFSQSQSWENPSAQNLSSPAINFGFPSTLLNVADWSQHCRRPEQDHQPQDFNRKTFLDSGASGGKHMQKSCYTVWRSGKRKWIMSIGYFSHPQHLHHHHHHNDNDNDNDKVRSHKKITGLFGNFSQMADPPPHPPLLGTPYSKKNFIVYFAF